jgi:hypothetical protein
MRRWRLEVVGGNGTLVVGVEFDAPDAETALVIGRDIVRGVERDGFPALSWAVEVAPRTTEPGLTLVERI